MKMRSKLFALLVFAIFASGCSSSASAPEETTQVETQSTTEVTEEDVQDVSEANTLEANMTLKARRRSRLTNRQKNHNLSWLHLN